MWDLSYELWNDLGGHAHTRKKNLKILGNYKKIPEMLGFDPEHPGGHPKIYFGTGDRKLQKNSCKGFHGKNYFTIV